MKYQYYRNNRFVKEIIQIKSKYLRIFDFTLQLLNSNEKMFTFCKNFNNIGKI